MKQEVVLVADDDEVVRSSLARTLKRAGYQVLTAADGREALATDMGEISVLITDICMPVISGTKLLLELKRRGLMAKVVLISSTCSAVVQELVVRYELPVFAILEKPLLDTNIIDVVKKAISSKND